MNYSRAERHEWCSPIYTTTLVLLLPSRCLGEVWISCSFMYTFSLLWYRTSTKPYEYPWTRLKEDYKYILYVLYCTAVYCSFTCTSNAYVRFHESFTRICENWLLLRLLCDSESGKQIISCMYFTCLGTGEKYSHAKPGLLHTWTNPFITPRILDFLYKEHLLVVMSEWASHAFWLVPGSTIYITSPQGLPPIIFSLAPLNLLW